MKPILIFTALIFLLGCKPILYTINGVNKERKFDNIFSYQKFVQEKYGIEKENLVFVENKNLVEFMNILNQQKIHHFYGIFINDSSKLKFSTFLADNTSCSNRVFTEIENCNKYNYSSLVIDTLFKTISLVHSTSNTKFIFPNNEKKQIVVVFSYLQGRFGKNDFKEIKTLLSKLPNYELLIISLDKLDIINF